jgi:rhodanese-related sulfurtransferase
MRRAAALLPQMLVLLLAAGAGGATSQWLRGHPVPWFEDWSRRVEGRALQAGIPLVAVAQAQALVEKKDHLVLDARPQPDFLAGHLPTAFSLPDGAFDKHLPDLLPLLTAGQPLLVYCSGLACEESMDLCLKLKALGYTNLVLFAGGITDWQAAKLPVER